MFLRKELFSRLSTYRFLGIGLATLLAVQPVMAAAPLTKDQQRQYVRFIAQLLDQSTGEQTKAASAALAVGQLPCMQGKNSIFGTNEWQELQGDALIKAIDKTETSFGHNVLRQTMQPTTDIKLIDMRRNQVKALLDDPKLFSVVGQELGRIKKAEDAILSYWDESQLENAGALFYKSKDFYYSLLAHKRLLGSGINSNRRYLEAASIYSMGKIALDFLFYLGLQGVMEDAISIGMGYGNDVTSDGLPMWNPWKSFKTGLKRPYTSFSPFLTPEGEQYTPATANKDTFRHLMLHGSMGDLFKILKMNYKDKNAIGLGAPGRVVHKTTSWSADCIGKHCDWGLGVKRCCEGAKNKFNAKGEFIRKQEITDSRDVCSCCPSIVGKGVHNAIAGSAVAAVTYYRAVGMYEALKSTITKARSYVSTMKELHVHTIHMARAMDAMQKLAGTVCDHEQLRTSCAAEHMHEVVGHPSENVKKLFDVLKESTFTLSKAKSHLYSRGNVLLAHRMFEKVKDELVPLLQAVGELDAAYSMACLIKEHQGSDTPFTFVEFVPEAQATINLEQAWLPMVKQPVANTINFGGDTHPNKIIMTGPNGGGKSVFLKTLGCILFAQSWGIFPAKRAQMSLFDGVRSCIHPQESIEHELSTFRAEKLRIDAIRQYVFQNNKPGFKGLLLLDEPFKGTVDAESADRIYAFGKEIAPLNGLIVAIATHVEKPIRLAADTGAYENYHVCIKELPDGKFEREFTIEPGVLRWWFDDPEKRSRFIDFVTFEKHKDQLEQSPAA